jgi:hypothetical protein
MKHVRTIDRYELSKITGLPDCDGGIDITEIQVFPVEGMNHRLFRFEIEYEPRNVSTLAP